MTRAEKVAAEPSRSEVAPALRFELRLVEERMLHVRRMQVLVERISPTRPILEALGLLPKDPIKARAWEKGVDLIHDFRLRHGITDVDGDPLGPKLGDAARRREREAAHQRLARLQHQLEHERVQAAERSLELLP